MDGDKKPKKGILKLFLKERCFSQFSFPSAPLNRKNHHEAIFWICSLDKGLHALSHNLVGLQVRGHDDKMIEVSPVLNLPELAEPILFLVDSHLLVSGTQVKRQIDGAHRPIYDKRHDEKRGRNGK